MRLAVASCKREGLNLRDGLKLERDIAEVLDALYVAICADLKSSGVDFSVAYQNW